MSINFSVLLPTRDRLELLKLAVESVLRQDYARFELIVSDNNSAQPVKEYLDSLADDRIVYSRFDQPVSVTANWNNAIAMASGDYIIMLGDDDALCANYFNRMSEVISGCEYPDCIYTGAYLFTYKDVIPGTDYGTVHENKNAVFWRGSYQPYRLDERERLGLVNDAMRLYSSYGFNMQFVTISRKTVEQNTTEHGFFRTQYPDYYAMNRLLLTADSFFVVEEPLVVIGASSSSFGWYYHNQMEDKGNKVLNIEAGMQEAAENIEMELLPGTSMNTNWLTSVRTLYADCGDIPGLVEPSLARYRRKQIVYSALMMAGGGWSREDAANLRSRLGPGELFLYLCLRPLAWLGSFGRRVLGFLHIASQKRCGYMLKALGKRLAGRSPVVRFSDDSSILDAERLMTRVN